MIRAVRPWHDARAGIILSRLLRNEHFDIIHTHSSKAGILGRVLGRLTTSAKIIHSPQGFYFLGSSGMGRRFYLSLERIAGRLTDQLVALSASERDVAIQYGIAPQERVALIENGVDPSEIQNRAVTDQCRSSLGIPQSAPLVGTLARFIPQKAPEDTLKVIQRVHASLPDAHFLWIGHGGPEEEHIRNQARELGLAEQVHFLGYRTDALGLVRLLDVFLLTSRWEGMPYSILEAMALAKPIVATAAVGTSDILEHNRTGRLAPVGDVEALAAHVVDLLRNSADAQELGSSALHAVETRFSQDRMLELTRALYLSVLHNAPVTGQERLC
jgi:glycosyltransferase involved in cell wall biosynthesis